MNMELTASPHRNDDLCTLRGHTGDKSVGCALPSARSNGADVFTDGRADRANHHTLDIHLPGALYPPDHHEMPAENLIMSIIGLVLVWQWRLCSPGHYLCCRTRSVNFCPPYCCRYHHLHQHDRFCLSRARCVRPVWWHAPAAPGGSTCVIEQGAIQGEILLDTSVIIDGRILDIGRTGFIQSSLVIPRFVLHELQHVADSADMLRRNRGKRGLEILSELQQHSQTPVRIIDDDIEDVQEVDEKLVLLARQRGIPVMTNDFNLNRVAELQGVHGPQYQRTGECPESDISAGGSD